MSANNQEKVNLNNIPEQPESRLEKGPENPMKIDAPNPGEYHRDLDFEEALALTGHGKINYIAILGCGCIIQSVIMETMGASYYAEFVRCDLNFTNRQTGVLAGICVVGIVTTQIFWGYLSDRYGRKKIILPTMILATVMSFLAVWCTQFWTMIVCRFIVGACISASSASIYAYLGELHTNEHRPFAVSSGTTFVSVAFVTLPILAWIVMHKRWSVSLGLVTLTYWRLFMCISIGPGVIGLTLITFLPESPRYHYSKGQLEDAKKGMAHMYAWNYNKQERDYPVDSIKSPEVIALPHSFLESLKNLKHFVIPPLLRCVLVTHTCAFFTFFLTSGLYVYLPNIISSFLHNINKSYSICDSFAERDKRAKVVGCDEVHIKSTIYPILIGTAIFFGLTFVTMGKLAKRYTRRNIYCIASLVFLSWMLVVPFLKSPILAMIFILYGLGFGCAMMMLMMLILDFFPTSLRGLALCTCYSFGRSGIAVATNIIEAGVVKHCTLTMFLMPFVTFAASFLVLLLPEVKSVRTVMEHRGFTY